MSDVMDVDVAMNIVMKVVNIDIKNIIMSDVMKELSTL